MLFQGISEIRHKIIDMCNLCFCFCVSRVSGKTWVCWRRRRTTNSEQSEIRYSISFFLYKNYIKKHSILPTLVFPSDYHKKQNTLAALRKKALDKNPDEFYFNMISSQLQVRSFKHSLAKHPTKPPKDTNWNSLLLSIDAAYCVMMTGWSSRSKKGQRGDDDWGAEESDEDPGHQICGDETGCRGKSEF